MKSLTSARLQYLGGRLQHGAILENGRILENLAQTPSPKSSGSVKGLGTPPRLFLNFSKVAMCAAPAIILKKRHMHQCLVVRPAECR